MDVNRLGVIIYHKINGIQGIFLFLNFSPVIQEDRKIEKKLTNILCIWD
jgi:hypothetical protein